MTQETVSLRFATEADARQIAEVHEASSQAIYRGLLPDEVLAYFCVTRREALWKEVLSESKTVTLLLKREGVVIGFADIGPTRDADESHYRRDHFDLSRRGVWGKGLGRKLFQRALDPLRGESFEAVTLWVLGTNRRAHAFYEKMGFEPDGMEKIMPMKIGER